MEEININLNSTFNHLLILMTLAFFRPVRKMNGVGDCLWNQPLKAGVGNVFGQCQKQPNLHPCLSLGCQRWGSCEGPNPLC